MEAVKQGDVLSCSECGVEIEVRKACECDDCNIICCGKPMEPAKKASGDCCCC